MFLIWKHVDPLLYLLFNNSLNRLIHKHFKSHIKHVSLAVFNKRYNLSLPWQHTKHPTVLQKRHRLCVLSHDLETNIFRFTSKDDHRSFEAFKPGRPSQPPAQGVFKVKDIYLPRLLPNWQLADIVWMKMEVSELLVTKLESWHNKKAVGCITACLETIRAPVSVATTRCCSGGYPTRSFHGVGVPYHVTYPMMHLMLPTLPQPKNRQMTVKTLPSRNFIFGR